MLVKVAVASSRSSMLVKVAVASPRSSMLVKVAVTSSRSSMLVKVAVASPRSSTLVKVAVASSRSSTLVKVAVASSRSLMLVNVHFRHFVDIDVICFRSSKVFDVSKYQRQSSMLVKSTLFMGRVPPTRGCNDRCRRRIVNNPSEKLFFGIDTKGAP